MNSQGIYILNISNVIFLYVSLEKLSLDPDRRKEQAPYW